MTHDSRHKKHKTHKCRENLVSVRPLKKAQMQGGVRRETRGVLGTYVAASREHDNAADGPFFSGLLSRQRRGLQ